MTGLKKALAHGRLLFRSKHSRKNFKTLLVKVAKAIVKFLRIGLAKCSRKIKSMKKKSKKAKGKKARKAKKPKKAVRARPVVVRRPKMMMTTPQINNNVPNFLF